MIEWMHKIRTKGKGGKWVKGDMVRKNFLFRLLSLFSYPFPLFAFLPFPLSILVSAVTALNSSPNSAVSPQTARHVRVALQRLLRAHVREIWHHLVCVALQPGRSLLYQFLSLVVYFLLQGSPILPAGHEFLL